MAKSIRVAKKEFKSAAIGSIVATGLATLLALVTMALPDSAGAWKNPLNPVAAAFLGVGLVVMLIRNILLLIDHTNLRKRINFQQPYSPKDFFPRNDMASEIGIGFEWTSEELKNYREILKNQKDYVENRDTQGEIWIHACRLKKDQPICLKHRERDKHMMISATTGQGKSVLLENLLYQDITHKAVTAPLEEKYRKLMGANYSPDRIPDEEKETEPVIFFDAKGSKSTLNTMYSACIEANRPKDFMPFLLQYPKHSVTYNPLFNYINTTDIAGRIMSCVTQSKKDEWYAFSHEGVNDIVGAMTTVGQSPTIVRIKQYITSRPDMEVLGCNVIRLVLQEYGIQMPPTADLATMKTRFTQLKAGGVDVAEEQKSGKVKIRATVNSAVGILKQLDFDQKFYIQRFSNVLPFLGKLTEPPAGELLAASSPDLVWQRAIEHKKCVFIAAPTLIDEETTKAICQVMLQDLVSVLGSRMSFTKKGSQSRHFINLYIDETARLLYDGFCNFLNQGREAGLRCTFALQSPFQIKKAIGDAAAGEVMDNANTRVFMKPPGGETAESLSKLAAMVILDSYSESNPKKDPAGGDEGGEAKGKGKSESKSEHEKHLIPPEALMKLPIGEAFVFVEGKLYKAKLAEHPKPRYDFYKERNIHLQE
jgi:conjugative coupling factor TraD (SXT/TOL subfamily)